MARPAQLVRVGQLLAYNRLQCDFSAQRIIHTLCHVVTTAEGKHCGVAAQVLLPPAFETAFLQRMLLKFTYQDAGGTQTQRIVEPQAMLILPPLWYLVAWDPDRDGFRHFRMDRISQPDLVEGSNFRRRHVPFAEDVCPYGDAVR